MTTTLPSIWAIDLNNEEKYQIESYVPLKSAHLEVIDGIDILYLNGSNYEMGYQYGVLVADKIEENFRAVINTLEQFGLTFDDLLETWEIQSEYTPQEYIDEMHGMADGSGIDYENICVCQVVPMFYRCCGAAAWGPATTDGKLIQMRSWDYDPNIRDPTTGTLMQENQLVIVRDPESGYASITPVVAGMCGNVGGINEQEIAIGQMTSLTYYNSDIKKEGTPMFFRIRYALDHTASIEDAIKVLNSNRTVGWNFIISDGKVPVGFVLEQTANFSYNGTFDDPVESQKPFYPIDHVVRRANIFISSQCAATQRKYYNPEPFAFVRYLLYKIAGIQPNFFVEFTHYNAISEALKDHLGNLDLNVTMDLLRDVYNFNTDNFWWTFLKTFFQVTAHRRIYNSLHQWVACPETGEILISFADADAVASENMIHHFNLYDLISP